MNANRERGQVAMGLIIMVLIGLCGVVAIQHWHQASQAQQRDSQDQVRTARWAESAIDAFAAWNARLPCPASTPGGREDCGLQGKGWLPVQTLLGHAPAPTWQPLTTRYVAYRGPGRDLVTASEVLDLDSGNPTHTINGYDLCRKVAGFDDVWHWTLVASSANKAFAYSQDESKNVVNVAYALAIAGQSGVMSGLNADAAAPGVEPPSRERDMSYRDYTVTVPFDTLHRRLGCGLLAASGSAKDSALASALPYGQMVSKAKAGTEKGFWLFSPLLAFDVAASTSALASDIGNLTNEADVSTQSAVYWAGCWVCLNFPAAIATEATATGTSAASLAWSTFGLATSIGYSAAYIADYLWVMATPEWSVSKKQTLAKTAEELGKNDLVRP